MFFGMWFPPSSRDFVQNVINGNERCVVSTKEQPMETQPGPAVLPRGQAAGMVPESSGHRVLSWACGIDMALPQFWSQCGSPLPGDRLDDLAVATRAPAMWAQMQAASPEPSAWQSWERLWVSGQGCSLDAVSIAFAIGPRSWRVSSVDAGSRGQWYQHAVKQLTNKTETSEQPKL